MSAATDRAAQVREFLRSLTDDQRRQLEQGRSAASGDGSCGARQSGHAVICDACGGRLYPVDVMTGAETCVECDRKSILRAITKAQAAREVGIARAEAAASDDDRTRIDTAIASVAKRGAEFSANDVRPLVPNVPGPLMGARFLAASRAGRIVKVGYVTSTDPGTHAHPVALWRAA